MGLSTATRMGTRGAMSPQLAQQIRLLGLSAQELESEMRQWLASNVMLEMDATQDADADSECETPEQDLGDELDLDSNWDDGYTPMAGSSGQPFDGEDALPAPALSSPMQILMRELPMECTSPRQLQACFLVLEALDERGWLDGDLNALACRSGFRTGELVSAMALIQRIGPPGIGARSLEECFSLQLQALPHSAITAAAQRVLALGLDRLARRELEQVRRAAGLDGDTFAAAMQLLHKLDPHPGRDAGVGQPIVPDVVVAKVDHRWTVTLSEFATPRLRINEGYLRALEQSGKASTGMRSQLTEARWLLRGLEQRADTLLRVAHAIFARQFAFLSGGDEALQPMALREIAAEVGVHESTVSRVTSNKYVLTPRGVFELKHFFSGGFGAGSVASNTAARALVRRLIADESPEAPLDDAALAARLAERGIRLARRTVAKYREGMGIPPAKLRGATQLALTA